MKTPSSPSSILSLLLFSLLLKSLNQSDNLSFLGRKLAPLNSAAPRALCFDVGFNFCLWQSPEPVHLHCASVCPWCVFMCPCAWAQPDPPVWSTKINKMQGETANGTATQQSGVSHEELLLSTAQRGLILCLPPQ